MKNLILFINLIVAIFAFDTILAQQIGSRVTKHFCCSPTDVCGTRAFDNKTVCQQACGGHNRCIAQETVVAAPIVPVTTPVTGITTPVTVAPGANAGVAGVTTPAATPSVTTPVAVGVTGKETPIISGAGTVAAPVLSASAVGLSPASGAGVASPRTSVDATGAIPGITTAAAGIPGIGVTTNSANITQGIPATTSGAASATSAKSQTGAPGTGNR